MINLDKVSNLIKLNWKSGITVSLVSIPLSVSLAVASQTTPTTGIITAVWAGLIASLFSGSHFNIVGPTGALSGILATYAITNGYETLPTLAVLTGFIVLISYFLKFEKFLTFVPGSAIQGFTLGVAFIIALNQLNFALGLKDLEKHEKFIDNLLESFKYLSQTSFSTFFVFVIFLFALFVVMTYIKKIPPAIVVTPFGILLGYLSTSDRLFFRIDTLGDRFSITPKLIEITGFNYSSSMLPVALTIAVIAILETMISAKIADGMTKTKHDRRKEILSLSFANIASGLAGGIPATAALARTSLNIKSGATNRISATISSISIAVISLLLLSYFKYIPMAVIAAILVYVAIRMVEIHHLIRYWVHDKTSFAIAIAVAAVTVLEDPIIGILLGTAISLILFVETLSRGQFELLLNHRKKGIVGRLSGSELKNIQENFDTLVYSVKGHLAYINSQAHISRFERPLKSYKNVILRLRELHFIDIDGVDAFDEIITTLREKKKKVLVSGLSEQFIPLLEKESENYKYLRDNGLIFEKTRDALQHLGYKISK